MKISLQKMLPFLGEEDLAALLEQVMNAENRTYFGVSLAELLPFLSGDDVERLFYEELKNGRDVSIFCPFLPDRVYRDIVKQVKEGSLDFDLDAIYPFLPDTELHELFRFVLENEDKN